MIQRMNTLQSTENLHGLYFSPCTVLKKRTHP